MIPIINQLGNVTLLAPINLAFTQPEDEPFDANSILRYVINQKVRVGYMGKTEMLFETLSRGSSGNATVSISPDFESQEYVVDKVAAIMEPDVYAKHQQSFIQGIDKLLPRHPSACEILMGASQINGQPITFVQQLFQLLFKNPSVHSDKKKHKKKKKHGRKAIPENCSSYLNHTKTLFIPSDEYVKSSLTDLERRYYLSLFNGLTNPEFDTTKEATKEMKEDVLALLDNLLLPDIIFGNNGTGKTHKATSGLVYNTSLATNSSRLLLNGHVLESSSFVASDTVLHIFDDQPYLFFNSLNIPRAPMIPRKALYALHFSNFVKELANHGLKHLVDGSTTNQTILAEKDLRDDVSDDISTTNLGTLSASPKQELLYQFIDGVYDFRNPLRVLVDSNYCSQKKIGSCFKIKVASSNSSIVINDDINLSKSPIQCANNTLIYFAEDEVEAPYNFKQTLGEMISNTDNKDSLWHLDSLSCFTTIEILKKFKLLSLPDNGKGYTIFLPISNSNAAPNPRTHWDRLGLVYRYLQNNPKEFRKVIRNLFVEGLIYSDFDGNHKTFKTIQGDKIKVRTKELSILSNEIHLNDTKLEVPLAGDILFNQGIIQAIDQVLLPRSLEVSIKDLIQTTFDDTHKAHYILDLLKTFPKLSKMILGHTPNHSLLIPSPLALKDYNVTNTFPKLLEFLEMHLVPNTELPQLLSCVDGGSYFYDDTVDLQPGLLKTNHSDVLLSCRHSKKSDTTYLKFHERDAAESSSYDKNHEVKVLSHGCVVGGDSGSKSCVFLINKPLNLDWLDHSKDDNFLHVHLGFVSVGIGIILGLLLFGTVFFMLVLCLGRHDKRPKPHANDYDEVLGGDFMDVRFSEEEGPPWDRGYETDFEAASETENLLPYKKKKKFHEYKSTGATAPLSIRGPDITNHLNRERNLPNY